MKNQKKSKQAEFSRRDFMKASAAVSLATLGAGASKIYAGGSDKIRLGLIGCGGRGTYDSTNCLKSAEGVELVAMGDRFKERLDSSLKQIKNNLSKPDEKDGEPDEKVGVVDEKIKVTEDRCFYGFDAYKKVLECDVDMVILTEPPHFRPEHLKAAIEAGKHVFMEKPIAVDPVGVRSVIASSELADSKKLTIVAGTQSRRMEHIKAIMERIHNGDIGKIVGGQCVRIGGGMMNWSEGTKIRKPEWSDMEWQLRRWLFLTWLSGDFITEMHIHNLDVMNWAMGSHPVKCFGLGGREVRTGPEYGNVFDHFSVEYEYPNGARIEYMGSQIDGCSFRSDERIVGTKGTAIIDRANTIIEGQKPFKYDGPSPSPVIRQHADQIAAIRQSKRLNEGKRIAESTLTSIMGRMSAYTGRALKWDWAMNASNLDLRPAKYEFGDLPMRPVAVPGKTKLVESV
ncbi:MAG: Gfo/Idh/MocA family oxidoreductase [Planctomycetota bacterium]|jgi:predicted dehydrogenase